MGIVCWFSDGLTRGNDGTTSCQSVDEYDRCSGCQRLICENHAMKQITGGMHIPGIHLKTRFGAKDD